MTDAASVCCRLLAEQGFVGPHFAPLFQKSTLCAPHTSQPPHPPPPTVPLTPSPSLNALFRQRSFLPCLHPSVTQALRALGIGFTITAGHKQQFKPSTSTLPWYTSVALCPLPRGAQLWQPGNANVLTGCHDLCLTLPMRCGLLELNVTNG